MPRGYKIIGVRCFKNNNNDNTLHFADFMIWKPKPGWLDISPQGRRAREAARMEKLNQLRMGISCQSWLETKEKKQKNFHQVNLMQLKAQQ